MEAELEAKFTAIDVPAFRAMLQKAGAVRVHPERLMRRQTFDAADKSLSSIGAWIRVRDEGDKVTMSYKRLEHRQLDGTKEVTINVSDFEGACNLLIASGLKLVSYMETKRERWQLGEVEVTIDTWPWIPPFVELEGPTEQSLESAAIELGFNWSNAVHGSVEIVYQQHYDFSEQEIDSWPEITFIPEPDWLTAKRR
jgi:adenylate cyclase class 2